MFFLILNIILISIIHQSTSSDWNYDKQGPDVWSDEYPLCAGHSQSPINIKTACTTYRSFLPFQLSSGHSQSQNFTLINNGHTISATLTNKSSSSITLTGGSLIGTYKFSSFHLHWGENYKSGSEHQINNKKYSGEIHLIYFNSITNQTAVFGIFIQTNKEINTTHNRKRDSSNSLSTEWDRYFSASKTLEDINDSIQIKLNLALLININFNQFWRYTGSLTTPPCTEGVIWNVFKQVIIINDNQFEYFRNNLFLKEYRDPQLKYNRIIYRSFLLEVIPSITDYLCCV